MTKPKPTRDKNGKFLPRGQIPRSGQRPDAPPSGGKNKPSTEGHLAAVPERSSGRRCCEDCGQELDEQRVIMRGHIIYVSACPRCTPEPLTVLQGE